MAGQSKGICHTIRHLARLFGGARRGIRTLNPEETYMSNEPDKVIYSMNRVTKRHGQREVLKDLSLIHI